MVPALRKLGLVRKKNAPNQCFQSTDESCRGLNSVLWEPRGRTGCWPEGWHLDRLLKNKHEQPNTEMENHVPRRGNSTGSHGAVKEPHGAVEE